MWTLCPAENVFLVSNLDKVEENIGVKALDDTYLGGKTNTLDEVRGFEYI